MERNIADQLNKAFEAYRQVSIEKDNAKKELQQITEHYQQYTQKLLKQIEDQQQLISQLKAQLPATRTPAGEMKCEACIHLVDGLSAHGKIPHPDNTGTVAVTPVMTVNSSVDYQDMLDALEAVQGTFRQIRCLSRRQKDHLKRFRGGIETANDQQFSMPIQCTDGTAEEDETAFSSALQSAVDNPLPPTSLTSRGAGPDDRDFVDSLTKLSVKFPPPADSEYDFLNSAPERHVGLTVPMRRPLCGASTVANEGEEEASELPTTPCFTYPTFPSHATSSSLSQENIRGPQQVRRSLCGRPRCATPWKWDQSRRRLAAASQINVLSATPWFLRSG
ncbi:TRAF family member-associated NF-kappa-B activator isoform X2 [Dunckerocampus dactyliophorus]|uniref:TRAF family member-associated NF-kappa-B activator isoform X2 n=1 Tax=Dunckerocampus dactyliophorus TaxID=161453 RepID=UPI0024073670|nr:TRAF family member-associated NF-kappa-B activator isoform X2 [Dunckerocampus dactyliophorus]